jgi:hypothetical protein
MFVWEMIACRLRDEGWSAWHLVTQDDEGYTVHLQRPGFAGEAWGSTLTDAYAEASRKARTHQTPATTWVSHPAMMAAAR